MSRGLRNRNPGNIRLNGEIWQGEIIPSQDKSFKQFRTMVYGYRAMFVLLDSYRRQGFVTLRKMIGRYAPPTENNTAGYLSAVVRHSGVNADRPLDTRDKSVMVPIVAAMSRVENLVPAVMADVEAGWDLYIRSRR